MKNMEPENNNLVGVKGKELWYPKFAPHIDTETGRSILDDFYASKELWYPKFAPHIDTETGRSILDDFYASKPLK